MGTKIIYIRCVGGWTEAGLEKVGSILSSQGSEKKLSYSDLNNGLVLNIVKNGYNDTAWENIVNDIQASTTPQFHVILRSD